MLKRRWKITADKKHLVGVALNDEMHRAIALRAAADSTSKAEVIRMQLTAFKDPIPNQWEYTRLSKKIRWSIVHRLHLRKEFNMHNSMLMLEEQMTYLRKIGVHENDLHEIKVRVIQEIERML